MHDPTPGTLLKRVPGVHTYKKRALLKTRARDQLKLARVMRYTAGLNGYRAQCMPDGH